MDWRRLTAAAIWLLLGLYFLVAILAGWGPDRPFAVAGLGTVIACLLLAAGVLVSHSRLALTFLAGVGAVNVGLLILWALLISQLGLGTNELAILSVFVAAIALTAVVARRAAAP